VLNLPLDSHSVKCVERVDYAIGASLLASREFVEDVGLMNEEYFLYYEELDWSIQGEKKGWGTFNCNKCSVLHKQGKTTQTGERYKNAKNLEIEKLKGLDNFRGIIS
jgi:GT2 family glycosyltransferase